LTLDEQVIAGCFPRLEVIVLAGSPDRSGQKIAIANIPNPILPVYN
jgi:hypothetical protein